MLRAADRPAAAVKAAGRAGPSKAGGLPEPHGMKPQVPVKGHDARESLAL